MIDFTDMEIDLASSYGGSDQKRGIIYHGERYMLKMSDRIESGNRLSINSSYSNSVFSEYISCHILNALGFCAQETLLGTLTVKSSKRVIKNVPVVACKNFIPDDCELIDFKVISNTLLTKKPGRITRLSELYEIFCNENIYFSEKTLSGHIAMEDYWNRFILDAFLGNFDRHAHNWAYIFDKRIKKLSLAPTFDCGSCLYPQLADDALDEIMQSEEEIQVRIDKIPNAALELENGEKTNYRLYMSSFENEDCTAALLRVYPKIDMDIVYRVIDNTPGISDIRKKFYKFMLFERYNRILTFSYRKYLGLSNHADADGDVLRQKQIMTNC